MREAKAEYGDGDVNRKAYEDRLIHVLLEEQLGGEAPPDLRERR